MKSKEQIWLYCMKPELWVTRVGFHHFLHTLYIVSVMTTYFLSPSQTDMTCFNILAVFPSIKSQFRCLVEMDRDVWLHSKLGRPMVLSLGKSEGLIAVLTHSTSLHWHIAIFFYPPDAAQIRCLPWGRGLYTHSQTETHTQTLIPSNVSRTPLRRW